MKSSSHFQRVEFKELRSVFPLRLRTWSFFLGGRGSISFVGRVMKGGRLFLGWGVAPRVEYFDAFAIFFHFFSIFHFEKRKMSCLLFSFLAAIFFRSLKGAFFWLLYQIFFFKC